MVHHTWGILGVYSWDTPGIHLSMTMLAATSIYIHVYVYICIYMIHHIWMVCAMVKALEVKKRERDGTGIM